MQLDDFGYSGCRHSGPGREGAEKFRQEVGLLDLDIQILLSSSVSFSLVPVSAVQDLLPHFSLEPYENRAETALLGAGTT